MKGYYMNIAQKFKDPLNSSKSNNWLSQNAKFLVKAAIRRKKDCQDPRNQTGWKNAV